MAISLDALYEYWKKKPPKPFVPRKKDKAVILDNTDREKEALIKIKPLTPEPEEVTEERVAKFASNTGLPYKWAETIIKIRTVPKPKNITASSWEEIETACSILCDNSFTLLKTIIAHNWSLLDVFGCNPDYPVTSFNVKGLVLLLKPTDVIIEVREKHIKIRSYSGGVNSFYRRLEQNVKCVLLCDID